ncbi:hypothetical protein A0H81_03843 [Grifola frondosa]|uniref:Secreted protein n=1 Tax=Grifola frondosa TaxID=5627 RepID=A0A1C7ML18_GRIFR|nr:hypothetical protein A0H81_03843 [Grifola frondosa]
MTRCHTLALRRVSLLALGLRRLVSLTCSVTPAYPYERTCLRPLPTPRTALLTPISRPRSMSAPTALQCTPVPVLVPAPMPARLIRAHTPRAPIVRARPAHCTPRKY